MLHSSLLLQPADVLDVWGHFWFVPVSLLKWRKCFTFNASCAFLWWEEDQSLTSGVMWYKLTLSNWNNSRWQCREGCEAGDSSPAHPWVSRSLTGLSGATTTLCLPGIWGSSSTGPEHFCIFQWENWIHPIDFKSPAFRATQRVLRALIFLGQALMFFLRVDEAAQGVQPWLSATSQDP